MDNIEEGIQEALAKLQTKAQVEQIAKEAAEKVEEASVNAVATSNVSSLSGVVTVADGVTLTAGMRVLLVGQTTATQNGIWQVASGAWVRPVGFASGETQPLGLFVAVREGLTQAGSIWVLKNKTAITVDTTAQEWLANSASTGTVALKELVRTYARASLLSPPSMGAGEFALEALSNLSVVEQGVHDQNTAFGFEALQLLNGVIASGLKPAKTAATAQKVIEITGIETTAAHVWSSPAGAGFSNTPVIVFRKLPAGTTNPKLNVAYFIVKGATNTIEVSETYNTAGITITGAALTAAETEIVVLASAEDNTAVGSRAGHNLTWGGGNTLIGMNAGGLMKTAEENTIIGCEAGTAQLTGTGNTAIGFRGLNEATASPNLSIGWKTTEKLTTGTYNIAIGNNALENAAGSSHNIAIGHNTLQAVTHGSNVVVGDQSAKLATTGEESVGIGYIVFNAWESGEKNVGVGIGALSTMKAASKNTALGAGAGAKTLGSGNLFLGNEAGGNANGSNELYIANNPTTPLIQGVLSGTQTLGLFGVTPVAKPKTTGTVAGVTPVETVAPTTEAILKKYLEKATYTGNLGTTKYTVSDVVLALKELGILTQ